MPDPPPPQIRNYGQVFRFATVGISNTAVDFAITNILVLAFSAKEYTALLFISVIACSAATLNSFVLNRSWTFRDGADTAVGAEAGRFFSVALVTMIVNTSVFLFAAKYLDERFGLPQMLAINAGKLAGVGAAMAVSFLGYRFGVFQTEALKVFRSQFQFERTESPSFLRQSMILTAIAAGVRGAYCLLTTAVFGDAVNYSWVAQSIASGDITSADPFWANLFCFWQALFHAVGIPLVGATVGSSFVPGVLLILPVVWMARTLYGPRVAWLAGALVAVHPRMVEYSCNGYAESFYLLAFATGIAFLMSCMAHHSIRSAIGWGVFFGIFAAVRPEALAAFAVTVVLYFLSAWWLSTPGLGRALLRAAVSVIMFAVVLAAYSGASQRLLGVGSVFQKASNLGKQFSEQLDMSQAARETYGKDGSVHGDGNPAPTPLETLSVLVKRYPRNLFYTLERMPGILLSPMIIFALLLPAFARFPREKRVLELPLMWIGLFPLVFYPLIQVEPRLFFPLLVPVSIFGAAGLSAFCLFATRQSGIRSLYRILVILLIGLGLTLSIWRGVDIERGYEIHRKTAQWVLENVPTDEILIGCGYGYITNTAFLCDHRAIPRLWTDDAGELSGFVENLDARWLILYEGFLLRANCELLPVLDRPLPGFDRLAEMTDSAGLRAQVFRLREE